jgi:branched-chain amino acid transport system permease protein
MAIGFAIIYSTTKIFHIPHGIVFILAGYLAFTVTVMLGMPLYLACIVVVIACGCLGIGMELLLYKPLRRTGADFAAMCIASLALYIILESAIALGFGTSSQVIYKGALPTYQLGPVTLTVVELISIAGCFMLFAMVQFFLIKTRLGTSIRAYAANPELAVTIGVDTDRLNVIVFALGSVLAGIVGIPVAYTLGVRPEMGVHILLFSCVAVIVGGVGSLPGCLMAGLLLGLAENLALGWLPGGWKDAIAYIILIAFLVLRPQGLLGRKPVEEV